MSGSVVFRWLLPAALAALLAIAVQTAGAHSMGGGGGHGMGGMGRGGFGGRGMMRGRPAMSAHFFSRSRMNGFANHQNLAFRNHNFDRSINRDRSIDRRDRVRDSHGLPDRGVDRRDAALDRDDREGRGDEQEGRGDEREGRQDIREGRQDIRQGNVQEGRQDIREGRQDIREGRQDIREGRQDVREAREGRFEHGEREFFFRHNFFVGFNFGAFGWWPGWWGWGWGGPWWWGWDGWAYPYPYCDYGYPYGYSYDAYDDPPASDSQYGSQEYWSDLAMSVQSKLADDGYYHGQIDGVLSSDTLEAIRQFQSEHGLAVDGKIEPKLLDALGIQHNQQGIQPNAEADRS
ncbi:MAG: peptidoglycan-binding protein [Verrucomicrobia bacterium]|nr:peptidoglycan-binding protein [Verrucomicrobiota bacterium]